MSYRGLIDEHVRLAILQVLEQDPDYAHNELLLQSALRALGHAVSGDRMRTELAWLEEQHLLVISDVSDMRVARLTQRGADAARGLARAPGVARPRPGG